jgi:hypothetical protein
MDVSRLSGLTRPPASFPHQPLDPPQPDRIFRHRHHVIHIRLILEEGEDVGRGKAGIPAHAESCAGESQQVGRSQEHRAAVRAVMVLIEPHDHRFPEKIREQVTPCRGMVGQRKSLRCGVDSPRHEPSTTRGLLFGSTLVNYPG